MPSSSLWEKLPPGFLKKTPRGWERLDYEVKHLIVKLAEKQNFRCAFCTETQRLIIEHDHYPDRGDGTKPTIHNIRGLTCHRCNRDLWLYEADDRGDYRGWEHYDPLISNSDYESYIDDYNIRLNSLHERELKRRCPNYSARRLFLDKFDEWRYDWAPRYPWKSYFEEIKTKRHGPIRTPGRFLRTLIAIMKFMKEQMENDPNFEPPKSFIGLMIKLKPFLDEAKRVAERQGLEATI